VRRGSVACAQQGLGDVLVEEQEGAMAAVVLQMARRAREIGLASRRSCGGRGKHKHRRCRLGLRENL
jgi:hypothetical protein